MPNIIFTFSMFITMMMGGCKEKGVEPNPINNNEKSWKEIELFKYSDIRYMIKNNGSVYVSAVTQSIETQKYVYGLYKTTDGINWDTVRFFNNTIGPIAFHGDTLTILEDGKTWKYHPSFGWVVFWEHLLTASHAYDMFWLMDKLYVFENSNDQIYTQDTVLNVRDNIILPNISKFFRVNEINKEVLYTRSYYVNLDEIYKFDGNIFTKVMNGIKSDENILANYPSMCVHNNFLYAGFNTPNQIKKLVNNTWINIYDTIPNLFFSDSNLSPILWRPTSITFYQDKILVGTESRGIIEWDGTKWKSLAKGLKKNISQSNLDTYYLPVVQVETIKDNIIVAYGESFYAPVVGGRGVYVLKYEQ